MKNHYRTIRQMIILAGITAGTSLTAQADANTVQCNVRVPYHAKYEIDLFRAGDRYPKKVQYNVEIWEGRTVTFEDVPTGFYFVRATQVDDHRNFGQSAPAMPIFSWAWWIQCLPDCWLYHH
ncbi:MAG: hypothetical protein JSS65_04745 [Armatimonadetes bacterium]|nr:hypothetical protein [Armatimonadota bacterium]